MASERSRWRNIDLHSRATGEIEHGAGIVSVMFYSSISIVLAGSPGTHSIVTAAVTKSAALVNHAVRGCVSAVAL